MAAQKRLNEVPRRYRRRGRTTMEALMEPGYGQYAAAARATCAAWPGTTTRSGQAPSLPG